MTVGGRNLFKFSHAMDDIVSSSFVLCLLFSTVGLMLHEIIMIVEQGKLLSVFVGECLLRTESITKWCRSFASIEV